MAWSYRKNATHCNSEKDVVRKAVCNKTKRKTKNEMAGWRVHGPGKDGNKWMERQSEGSRGLEAYCKGGQGPPRALALSKKKKEAWTWPICSKYSQRLDYSVTLLPQFRFLLWVGYCFENCVLLGYYVTIIAQKLAVLFCFVAGACNIVGQGFVCANLKWVGVMVRLGVVWFIIISFLCFLFVLAWHL